MISIDDQIACAKRELAMRGRVYPRWADAGKMKPTEAALELARMTAIISTLEAVRDRTGGSRS